MALKDVDKKKIWQCKYCGKEMSFGSLASHAKFCVENPNRQKSIDRVSELRSGKPLSEKHRQAVSQARRKFLEENPDKAPYRLNHSSKESYAEARFRELLEKHLITGWVQELPFSMYRLDFAFPEIKLDVEIDGATHSLVNVAEIDRRRDEYLASQGWKVLRISATKLKRHPDLCIEELKEKIGPVV